MLRPLQSIFDPAEHPDLIVGLGMPDDAAVYRLDDERALIFTTDFFTPIVDDAYQYGAIAAANSLSDVYAMGGRPIMALNIVAFPDQLPISLLGEILRGAAEKVREAGAVIAGGHTITDKEPKAGLAVVGLAQHDQLMTKGGVQPGQVLALTKPIGSGVITTAGKGDKASPEHLAEAVRWMSQLNRAASEAAIAAGARAATDVTGFGLMGHAVEMAEASGVTLRLHAGAIPLLEGAMSYAEQWLFPGGSSANREAFETRIAIDPAIRPELAMLLFDAQTSGGLLIALPPDQVERFSIDMRARNAPCWIIGEAIAPTGKAIEVTDER